jgi:site-specific DNA-methyltransferase (adenine-specific)
MLIEEQNGNFAKPVLGAVPSVVYNEDCVEGLKRFSDNHFDLAIVDPPYAVGASNGNFGRGGKKSKIKEYKTDLTHYENHDEVPNEEYFEQLFRVSKNQIIWGANYYPEYLGHSGWIVWDKMKSDGLLSEAELAYQSFDKVVKIFRHEWEGFRKGKGSFEETAKSIIHPNQKPLKLYEWCLSIYAKPNDKILDTHLGSGSSRIACSKGGFDFTGFELSKKYYEAQEKRFKDFVSQLRMF